MVAIQMLTYNHENYIAQAIESAVSQQTNFNYKLIICEDFSTDNTRNICKQYKMRYPDKIELVLNEKFVLSNFVLGATPVLSTLATESLKF